MFSGGISSSEVMQQSRYFGLSVFPCTSFLIPCKKVTLPGWKQFQHETLWNPDIHFYFFNRFTKWDTCLVTSWCWCMYRECFSLIMSATKCSSPWFFACFSLFLFYFCLPLCKCLLSCKPSANIFTFFHLLSCLPSFFSTSVIHVFFLFFFCLTANIKAFRYLKSF